jgi:hypothetical protein
MLSFMQGRRGATLVVCVLLTQAGLLYLSFDDLMQISIFCTVSQGSKVGWLFGLLHWTLLALFVAGVMSLVVAGLRIFYVCAMVAALLALPVQASLVEQGTITCDGP